MRALAIDHGLARCGCALSDPTGTVVRPLPVIEPPDPREVARLVSEHDVDVVVIGLPVGLGGESGAQAAAARRFRDDVATLVDVPVETYDERLTTRMAEQTARSGASAAEDSLAAAHLLESYLQSREAARARQDDHGEVES
jgi:putative Holliday junction resolvase